MFIWIYRYRRKQIQTTNVHITKVEEEESQKLTSKWSNPKMDNEKCNPTWSFIILFTCDNYLALYHILKFHNTILVLKYNTINEKFFLCLEVHRIVFLAIITLYTTSWGQNSISLKNRPEKIMCINHNSSWHSCTDLVSHIFFHFGQNHGKYNANSLNIEQ